MDDLIIRYLSGTASSFEEERLKRWREESQENELLFQETLQVWDLTQPESAAVSSPSPPVEAVIAAAERRPVLLPGKAREKAVRSSSGLRRIRWGRWGILAASLAAVSLGVRAVLPSGPTPLARYAASEEGSLTTALGDGSFVRLAPGSRLTEWPSEGGREVSLEGQAFFAVARDESRPFRIHAGSGEVSVLGTRFEVREEEDDLRTVVVEGRVRVENARGAVEVTAGQVAEVTGGDEPTARSVDDVYALLSWGDGLLIYQATPLSQVAVEVSRHFGRTLTVSAGTLESRRITAWFQDESFEEVAESLCMAAGAVCRVDGDGVVMEPGSGVEG